MRHSIENADRRQELLIAERAAEWLSRLKTAGPQERAAFLSWLKESRQHVREILLATTWDALLEHIDPQHTIDIQDLIDSQANLVPVSLNTAVIHPRERPAPEIKRRRWPWFLGLGTTAAAMVLMFTIHVTGSRGFETAVGEQRAFELADGSIVHLNTRSQVSIDFSAAARDVYLQEGQAIFKVKHDAARPFRVHVDDDVIQAIGTQFDVHRQGDRTNVAVIEGSVQIISKASADLPTSTSSESPERTRVTAGELASIVGSGKVTPAAPINVAEISAWQQRRLIFRLHTLEQIAAEFNRYNSRLQINIEGDVSKATRLSGVFDADDPESLLKYLASEGNFEFERDGGNLTIRPRPKPAQEPAAI